MSSDANCIFCRIVRRELPANIVYEDDDVMAFHDINPQAPVHILVIPKKHIPTLNDIQPEDQSLIGKIFLTAKEVARMMNIHERGYRTVFNCNREAGQAVYHIHLHVLGGRIMTWPPG